MAGSAPIAPALASTYAPPAAGAAPTAAAVPGATRPVMRGDGVFYPSTGATLPSSYGPDTVSALAAPAPAAAPANPYQAYIDAFNASQLKQRGAIDQMLHQSMGELQGRRDAAAQVVAGLPEQVAAAYNQASGGLQSGTNAATAALSPDVKGTAAAISAPLQSALAQDKGGADALGPFLQLAMRANADSGQAALENSAFNANAGLDQQNAQFQQSMLMQQAQQAQQHAWATDPQNPDSLVGKEKLLTDQNKAAVDAQPAAASNLQGSGLTNGDVTSLRSSGEYQRFTNAIKNSSNGGKWSATNLDPVQVTKELATKNPKLLALLQAENPMFFGTVDAKGKPLGGARALAGKPGEFVFQGDPHPWAPFD